MRGQLAYTVYGLMEHLTMYSYFRNITTLCSLYHGIHHCFDEAVWTQQLANGPESGDR